MVQENKDREAIIARAIGIASDDERDNYIERACGDDDDLKQSVKERVAEHFQEESPDDSGDQQDDEDDADEQSQDRDKRKRKKDKDEDDEEDEDDEQQTRRRHKAKSRKDEEDEDEEERRDQDREASREERESSNGHFGRYKIVKQNGEHVWGADFLAEQEEGEQRKVTLEVIRPGLDWKQIVSRFEAERPTLSRLEHPNIARVLDIGTRPSGQPYLVMEWIDGPPITTSCDDNKLELKKRLELFVTVCLAVEYAHQKGIIHGGLEPATVRIVRRDDKPVPKILDFGVARATRRKPSLEASSGNAGDLGGNPLYMSPEQADLNIPDLDTRSDVYSLGVLLYELLTGTTPLPPERLREVSKAEALRLIREEVAPPPSTRLEQLGDKQSEVAKNRGMKPKALIKALNGELDCIVLKALRKDRENRYQTVHELAKDVRHHMAHEPVEACPPSDWRQVRSTAGRHKWAVRIMAALLVLLLILALGGTGLTIYEWHEKDQVEAKEKKTEEKLKKAEKEEDKLKGELHLAEAQKQAMIKERDKAQKVERGVRRSETGMKTVLGFLKNKLLAPNSTQETSITDAFWNKSLDISMRQAVDRAEQKVAETFADHPLGEAVVREMLGQAYLNLGEAAKAAKQYQRTLALREAIQGPNNPDTQDAKNQLAIAYRLSDRTEEASRLFEQRPDSSAHAAALVERAKVLLEEKQPAESEVKLRQALTIRQKTQPDAWTTFETKSLLGEALLQQKKFVEAEPLLQAGYQGLKQHEDVIPHADKKCLTQAIERLVKLYDAEGKRDVAEQYRKEWEEAKATKKP
jgi:serine/threonine protein kinase/tetratricopeptide (TPR) repeat protein